MTEMEGTPRAADPTPQPDYLMAPPAVAGEPPTPPAQQAARGTGYVTRLTAAVVAAIILATGGGIGIGWNLARIIAGRQTGVLAPIQVVAPVSPSPGAKTDPSAVAASVIPAVVDINT